MYNQSTSPVNQLHFHSQVKNSSGVRRGALTTDPTCRLPIDMATGEPVYAEASVRGKKREAVVQCALNACRILDAQDMLRNPTQGGLVHKVIAVPYR